MRAAPHELTRRPFPRRAQERHSSDEDDEAHLLDDFHLLLVANEAFSTVDDTAPGFGTASFSAEVADYSSGSDLDWVSAAWTHGARVGHRSHRAVRPPPRTT